jgi:hypothetical protein
MPALGTCPGEQGNGCNGGHCSKATSGAAADHCAYCGSPLHFLHF